MNITLHNTLTRKKEIFKPIDENHIKMYVCGPTVYDTPHIGNARSIVVYDNLYRLLRYTYPDITYVRNITDVDDKINIAAKARNIPINNLTQEITEKFHKQMDMLNCLRPNIEPKATEHIAEMIDMISHLIEKNHAYISNNNVYFRVSSSHNYGVLAGRKLEDLIHGARIEINDEKEHPGDFILWKTSDPEDDPSSIFPSPWCDGRPGWHIECSAMSAKYLGPDFDIHGGGADLMFPHHTNEIAQTCARYPDSKFATYWVHNGFVTVDGEKMSKSLGNFITLENLFAKQYDPIVIRFALMHTHYRKPLNWTESILEQAYHTLKAWKKATIVFKQNNQNLDLEIKDQKCSEKFLDLLANDLNIPACITYLHKNCNNLITSDDYLQFIVNLELIGIKIDDFQLSNISLTEQEINIFIKQRHQAKLDKDYKLADQIRENLKVQNVVLQDHKNGTTSWQQL